MIYLQSSSQAMADIGKREMKFFEYLDKEKSIFR